VYKRQVQKNSLIELNRLKIGRIVIGQIGALGGLIASQNEKGSKTTGQHIFFQHWSQPF